MSNSDLNVLYKKDGTKVEVNDNSLEYALDVLGWTDKKPATKKTPKKASKAD